jgi:hypothetical protein
MAASKAEVVELLNTAYSMELETVRGLQTLQENHSSHRR